MVPGDRLMRRTIIPNSEEVERQAGLTIANAVIRKILTREEATEVLLALGLKRLS